jgi:hypothetical protein
VYNFEVKDWHCYFVGEKGVLVHNSNLEACKNVGGIAESAVGKTGGNTGETSHGKPSVKQKTGPKPQGTGAHNLKIEEIANQIFEVTH